MRFLEHQGFQVIEAEDAGTAVALLSDSGRNIDLLVVDVALPRISGLALADRAKTLLPEIKVLFMSGYPIRTLERNYGISKEMISCLLLKPFRMEALTRKIREILGRRDPSRT